MLRVLVDPSDDEIVRIVTVYVVVAVVVNVGLLIMGLGEKP